MSGERGDTTMPEAIAVSITIKAYTDRAGNIKFYAGDCRIEEDMLICKDGVKRGDVTFMGEGESIITTLLSMLGQINTYTDSRLRGIPTK